MYLLDSNDIEAVSGGHSTLGIAGVTLAILEIPHMIIGLVEFWNYFADWSQKGCGDVDEDDHFRQTICNIVS